MAYEDKSLNCTPSVQPPSPVDQRQIYDELKQEKQNIALLKAKKCKRKWKFNFTFCPCPICASYNRVKDKAAGKTYIKIPFTKLKIPKLWELLDQTKSFESNSRPGKKCGACNGTRKLSNVNDDKATYQKAHEKMVADAKETMELESLVGGLGGTDTKIILGSKVEIIGAKENTNRSFEVIENGSIAPCFSGNQKIPQTDAKKVNAVKGIQAGLQWPQHIGSYSIKCGNRYALHAGSGGIAMATTGPCIMQGGIMRISGASISIGCSQGPLTLEGNSVTIGGSAITIAPTSGATFFKGSIHSSGNLAVQGQAHAESLSFVKATTVGKRQAGEQSPGNPDVTVTRPAIWSYQGVAAALLDIQVYYANIAGDYTTAAIRLLSPSEMMGISTRMAAMAKLCVPFEMMPTGWILPFNFFWCLGILPTWNYGPVPVFNVPHTHGLPEMQHSHDYMVPDMTLVDSPAQLRARNTGPALMGAAPFDGSKDIWTRLKEMYKLSAEFVASIATSGVKKAAEALHIV